MIEKYRIFCESPFIIAWPPGLSQFCPMWIGGRLLWTIQNIRAWEGIFEIRNWNKYGAGFMKMQNTYISMGNRIWLLPRKWDSPAVRHGKWIFFFMCARNSGNHHNSNMRPGLTNVDQTGDCLNVFFFNSVCFLEFGEAMKTVRDGEFLWKRSGNAGLQSPTPDPDANETIRVRKLHGILSHIYLDIHCQFPLLVAV